jgi:hypothetical protein
VEGPGWLRRGSASVLDMMGKRVYCKTTITLIQERGQRCGLGQWVEFDSARRRARIPERRLDKAQLIHSSLPLTSILFVHITKMRPSMQLNAGGMPGREWFFWA